MTDKLKKKSDILLERFVDNIDNLFIVSDAPADDFENWFHSTLKELLTTIPANLRDFILLEENYKTFSETLRNELKVSDQGLGEKKKGGKSKKEDQKNEGSNDTTSQKELRLIASGGQVDNPEEEKKYGWVVQQKSWPDQPKYVRLLLSDAGLQVTVGTKALISWTVAQIDKWGISEKGSVPKLMIISNDQKFFFKTRLAPYIDRKLQRRLGEVDPSISSGEDEELRPDANGKEKDKKDKTRSKHQMSAPPSSEDDGPPPPPEHDEPPPPPPTDEAKKPKKSTKKVSTKKEPAKESEPAKPERAERLSPEQETLKRITMGEEPDTAIDQDRWGWAVEQRSWPKLPKYLRMRVNHNGLQLVNNTTIVQQFGLYDLDSWGVKKGVGNEVPALMIKIEGKKYVIASVKVPEIEQFLQQVLA